MSEKLAQSPGPYASSLLTRLEHWRMAIWRYVPLIITLVIIAMAVWGYRGSQAAKLGPPLGSATGQDFMALLQAARDVGAGEDLYTDAIAFGAAPDFEAFVEWEVAPYVYPPIVAVIAQPLTWIAPEVALQLWVGLNLLLLLTSAVLAVDAFTNTRLRHNGVKLLLVLALFFSFYPVQYELKLGQIDIMIVWLLLLAFWLYRRGHVSAGVPLALAMVIKPLLAPMLLFFLRKRQWPTMGVTIVTAGVLTLLGFFVVGWHHLQDYLMVSRLWSGGPFLVFPVNQSVTALALRAFTVNGYIEPVAVLPWLAWMLPWLIGGLAAIGWFISISQVRQQHAPISGIEYGLTITTLMLLSPLAESIHFVWVLVPLAALLLYGLISPRGLTHLIFLGSGLLIALYLAYPALTDKSYAGYAALLHSGALVARENIVSSNVYLYGLLALQLCLVLVLRHQRWHARP